MYLLDTNVLSHVLRRQPPPNLVEHLRQHAVDRLFTSCICVMELRHGAMRRADRGALWSRIEREVLTAEGPGGHPDVATFRLSRFAEGKPIRGTYGDWLMC